MSITVTFLGFYLNPVLMESGSRPPVLRGQSVTPAFIK